MPAIRRRYHYANIIMCPTIFGQTNVLCGQTVELVLSDTEAEHAAFYGFADWNDINSESFCLVKSIVGFTMEDAPFIGNWVEYSKDDLILGAKSENGVKVVVKNRELVNVGKFQKAQTQSNNTVVSIFDRK